MDNRTRQIKLIGESEFQTTLKSLYGRVLCLSSKRCYPSHVARIAVSLVDPDDIVDKLESGCCSPDAPWAKAPKIASVRLPLDEKPALDAIVAKLLASDYPHANYTMAVHGAICALAEWTDDEISQGISVSSE